MDIILSSSGGKPIYEQITSQIKGMIMSGQLKAGDALPSMRMLAKSLHISVITAQPVSYTHLGEMEDEPPTTAFPDGLVPSKGFTSSTAI